MSDEILLHAEGNAFIENKFDLRSLELIVTNYRQIIDNTVPLALGQQSLTSKLKKELRYNVQVKSGSLDIFLEFLWEHKEEVMLLFASDGGYTLSSAVMRLIDAIIKFRRLFTNIIEKGIKPKIQIIGNKIDFSVGLINNKIEINNPTIILGAEKTKSSIDRFIMGVDGKAINNIKLNHNDLNTVFTEEDKRLTGTDKKELTSDIEIFGRLDMVACTSHKGHVITGNKRYPVTWDESIKEKVLDLIDKDACLFKVYPIVDNRRFKEEPIGFHVLDCWDPQLKLNI